MQIHEIFRRRTNEGILKGVRTTPPRNDRGRFMPVAATGAFNQMATQLQKPPAAAPAVNTTPAQTPPPSDEGPNPYMSVAPSPAQPAPAAKPVGLTPADIEKLKAQDKSKPPAVALNQQPKAGFARNAAEYFANKTLNAAGIPQGQQGQYHPGGHMAASMGQGNTAIRKQETDIASQLSREWLRQNTLNQKPSNLAPDEIKAAANLINQTGSNQQINLDNVAKLVIQTVNDKQAAQQAAQQQTINNFRNALKMKKNLEQDSNADEFEKQRMAELVKKSTEQMKNAGLGNQVSAIAASILRTQAPATNTLPMQPAAPAPSTDQMRGAKPGAPTTQDYANLEKRLQQAMAAQGQTQ